MSALFASASKSSARKGFFKSYSSLRASAGRCPRSGRRGHERQRLMTPPSPYNGDTSPSRTPRWGGKLSKQRGRDRDRRRRSGDHRHCRCRRHCRAVRRTAAGHPADGACTGAWHAGERYSRRLPDDRPGDDRRRGDHPEDGRLAGDHLEDGPLAGDRDNRRAATDVRPGRAGGRRASDRRPTCHRTSDGGRGRRRRDGQNRGEGRDGHDARAGPRRSPRARRADASAAPPAYPRWPASR
jgi:hypothetical protein